MEINIPAKTPLEKKTKNIGLWLTEEDYDLLVTFAKKHGVAKTTLARHLFLSALEELKKTCPNPKPEPK
jgi:hypothetical protein